MSTPTLLPIPAPGDTGAVDHARRWQRLVDSRQIETRTGTTQAQRRRHVLNELALLGGVGLGRGGAA